MLDVHPPEHPAHSWRDFFIHVATICVGLLIAIALEQSVEWLHHLSEVRETRQLLREERAQNVQLFHTKVTYARQERAQLENDLRIFQYLQQHPGTPLANLPGIAYWRAASATTAQASWAAAKQANILALMPQPEVEESRGLYDQLDKADQKEALVWDEVNKAGAYSFLQPDPSKLTPAQIDAEIPLIQDCLRATYLLTVDLNNIGRSYPDFAPGPSLAELDAFRHSPEQATPANLPAAYAFTRHDLDAAAALDKADQPGIEFAKQLSEQGTAHAVEIYQQLHARYPNFKPQEGTLNTCGYELIQANNLPAAISVLQLNTQLYPDSWNVYDSLGEAYAKSGNKPLAIANYQQALKLNPSSPGSANALKKLQP